MIGKPFPTFLHYHTASEKDPERGAFYTFIYTYLVCILFLVCHYYICKNISNVSKFIYCFCTFLMYKSHDITVIVYNKKGASNVTKPLVKTALTA